MKKIIALLAAVALAGVAFAEDVETKISQNELPEKAQTFLSTYFTDIKVKKVIKTTDLETAVSEYDVVLADKTMIEFDMVGAWNEITIKNKKAVMPRFIYPKRVNETLDKQYAGMKITKVSNDGMDYEFNFKGGTEVTINALGKVVEVEFEK